jgi:myo-inositol-1-phosphate synthase
MADSTSYLPSQPAKQRRLGLVIQGVGGAVSTTATAGLALIRRGMINCTGLPLARLQALNPQAFANSPMAEYARIAVAGWDLCRDDLCAAAKQHAVLPPEMLSAVADELSTIRPWAAIATPQFGSGVLRSDNERSVDSHREAIKCITDDMARFRSEQRLDGLVMINLSSTEAPPASGDCLQTIESLERALDANDPRISASVLYAYAAITSDTPHVNFTPTRVTDWPSMLELAARRGVPVCGKDGKTGQTLIKTVLAPALRDRNLRVEGWFSTNLLGNRDGQVLADPRAVQSKLATKTDVLEAILGYPVPDHQVHIHYYPPRGDCKEAWDAIDLVGFAGQRMQVKVNFLCRDSILAAPLVIDLGRLADLAQLSGARGAVEPLGVFFKSLITATGAASYDFAAQQACFEAWLFKALTTKRHTPFQ